MAGLFEKGFNKFADMGNSLNKGINNAIGKDVFGEIKKLKPLRNFHHMKVFHHILFLNQNNGNLLLVPKKVSLWTEIL